MVTRATPKPTPFQSPKQVQLQTPKLIPFQTPKLIPFHRPLIEEEDIQAVVEVLKEGWITSGPKVHEFELAFADSVGARNAVAVNSCTAGLHIALDAVGIRPADEVLVPTLTFTATAEVVAYFRAKPVLCDSEPGTFNLDPLKLESAITSRTRAVIPVHFGGQSCEMDTIAKIASTYNLTVVEDAAHAFPAKYKGRNVGTLSWLTAFSFYATKTITTGEGGMVTTDDDAVAQRMRVMSLHGMNHDAWKRYSGTGSWRYEVVAAGFKYNMTDIQAALGLAQLGKAERMRLRRKELAARYSRGLRDCVAYQTLEVVPDVEHAWHLFVILIDPEYFSINRDQLIDELKSLGVGTAVHFIPLHRHPYYRDKWGYRPEQFPVAEWYFERCISLPLYPGLSDEETDLIVEHLRALARKFKR